jgi:hypothetical protein
MLNRVLSVHNLLSQEVFLAYFYTHIALEGFWGFGVLGLNGFSAWGAPDPEHVRFCARLPGRTVLDSSTCVDFDVTSALPFP